jgi:hypothetical protein
VSADELSRFVTARLDEDEAALADDARDDGARFLDADHQTERFTGRFAGEDRVRREVAAKRAILAAWQTEMDRGFPGSGFTEGLEFALRHLAAVYSDHDQYEPGWAPEGAPDGT